MNYAGYSTSIELDIGRRVWYAFHAWHSFPLAALEAQIDWLWRNLEQDISQLQ